ncbi:hypothetical protein MGYG_08999 [Nannizzia gypsea CBS 118893]|uniref:Uncharacterized protein n=1 Tax=Arthroderma gypseum (strain ATCC MYA-4604 / CBS 118893) TaxID=535722 RepID=E4UPS4_ARTGP|nr:hypothetical protein MGYG_08999 [Nannizzia gypsea CBS 118893]EFQ99896.1 hypothetical protein MGYG_08999 [Nannizzia gypsea CBS 118893]
MSGHLIGESKGAERRTAVTRGLADVGEKREEEDRTGTGEERKAFVGSRTRQGQGVVGWCSLAVAGEEVCSSSSSSIHDPI